MTSSRTLRFVSLLTFLVATAAGCADARRSEQASVGTAPMALQAGAPGAQAPADRAMRITIETSVTVKDVDAAGRAVRELVAQHGGYVGEARTNGDDEARSSWFEAHVPVAHLPAFRAGVSGLGEIASDSEKAEDVTEQRADIKARLGNARAGEKRLLELLDKRTGTLADVVAVEKELGAVRETVERMEAQERVLEGQIASATVKIHLGTRHAVAHLGAGKRIVRALGDGVDNAGSFVVGLVVVGASSGPTVLLLALMGYLGFRAVRAVHRRINPKKA